MSEVKTESAQSFLGGSAADLLNRFKTGQPVQQPATQQQPIQQQPITQPEVILEDAKPLQTTIESPKSAAELLAGKPKEEENSATPSGEAAVTTETTTENKGGRPSNKLPEGFSDLVSQLEEKQVLKGFNDGKYNTIDDFVALLEANAEDKIETYKQEAENRVIGSMSPAMKAIYDYASMGVKSTDQLLPLLTAADDLNYSTSLDPKNPEHQQAIVRNGLAIQGLSNEDIEAEIKELLETEGKLEKRASNLKPVLDKYNTKRVEDIYKAQQQEVLKERQFWDAHQKEVKKQILDAPTVSDLKLKKDQKEAAAYFLNPDPVMGGLPIYALIDDLIDKKEFGLLTEIILLGINKKDYQSLITTAAVQKTNADLVRQLKDSTKSTPTEQDTNQPVQEGKIQRNPNRLSMDRFRK